MFGGLDQANMRTDGLPPPPPTTSLLRAPKANTVTMNDQARDLPVFGAASLGVTRLRVLF